MSKSSQIVWRGKKIEFGGAYIFRYYYLRRRNCTGLIYFISITIFIYLLYCTRLYFSCWSLWSLWFFFSFFCSYFSRNIRIYIVFFLFLCVEWNDKGKTWTSFLWFEFLLLCSSFSCSFKWNVAVQFHPVQFGRCLPPPPPTPPPHPRLLPPTIPGRLPPPI